MKMETILSPQNDFHLIIRNQIPDYIKPITKYLKIEHVKQLVLFK